ncbi:MAG: hypothetical protein KQI62_03440 [Deltaproteobacteria bacterium]|nr:hypothetical protein [Deltaproteobacteria bacterium]
MTGMIFWGYGCGALAGRRAWQTVCLTSRSLLIRGDQVPFFMAIILCAVLLSIGPFAAKAACFKAYDQRTSYVPKGRVIIYAKRQLVKTKQAYLLELATDSAETRRVLCD